MFRLLEIHDVEFLIQDDNHEEELFHQDELDLLYYWRIPIEGISMVSDGYLYWVASDTVRARLALQYGVHVKVYRGELQCFSVNPTCECRVRLSDVASRLGHDCISEAYPLCTLVIDDKIVRIHSSWCKHQVKAIDLTEIENLELLYSGYSANLGLNCTLLDRLERAAKIRGIVNMFMNNFLYDECEFDDDLTLQVKGNLLRRMATAMPAAHIQFPNEFDTYRTSNQPLHLINLMTDRDNIDGYKFVSPTQLSRLLTVFGITSNYIAPFRYYTLGGRDPVIVSKVEERLLYMKRKLEEA